MKPLNFLSFVIIVLSFASIHAGNLFPKLSSTRRVKSLNGIWKFSLSENCTFNNNESLSSQEDDQDLHLMPVPSSYNDVLTTMQGRDHVGPVKYERTFLVPNSWLEGDNRVWLRFGSVCYSATVYVNGEMVMFHQMGHLPFEGEITPSLSGSENTVTVIVDNTLNYSTLPQGDEEYLLESGRTSETHSYDFFNYAGIDRPVYLYSTPQFYLEDVFIRTILVDERAFIIYVITVGGEDASTGNQSILFTVIDKERNVVVEKTGIFQNSTLRHLGVMEIPDPTFWWPMLMDDNPGYLYTLKVQLMEDDLVIDEYDQSFGLRELTWSNDSYEINGLPIYIRGVGKHEDADIRGKGLDLPLLVRDHNLMKWLGVNCYRTSHYPYSEEMMNMADSLGIMIIDEVPAATLDYFNDTNLLENHKTALSELYNRDKNRPSVIMWSIANEPNLEVNLSENYFKEVAEHIRTMEFARPITLTNYHDIEKAQDVFQYLDIICHNLYAGWYVNPGDTSFGVTELVIDQIQQWRENYSKPIIFSEYGADSWGGLHRLPSYIWSEEYQLDILSQYFKAFDVLRKNSWFLGEMIWNFADFKTSSDIRRVGGNNKGIFTRQRQPKEAAFFLRRRYWLLAQRLHNVKLPDDLRNYVMK